MNEFCILIVSPPGTGFEVVFTEIAIGFQGGFAELGFHAPIVTRPDAVIGRPIVFGVNAVPKYCPNYSLPRNAILVNLEVVESGSAWITKEYLALLRDHTVWDYSASNIRELTKLGVQNVQHCEIGYAPQLERISHVEEDIDVLFYGTINQRRKDVLTELVAQGVNVHHEFGLYGRKRDGFIGRAKIVLNLHYYESKVFEIVRVSYLLANKRFVISEDGSDKALEAPFVNSLVFSKYEDIVDNCVKFLKENEKRTEIAERGLVDFKQRSQAEFIRRALSVP